MKKQTQNQFDLMSDSSLIEALLSNWNTLNKAITKLNKRQLAVLLIAELKDKQREPIIRRLHQRYGILRSKDEWKGISAMMRAKIEKEDVTEKLHVYGLDALREELI